MVRGPILFDIDSTFDLFDKIDSIDLIEPQIKPHEAVNAQAYLKPKEWIILLSFSTNK